MKYGIFYGYWKHNWCGEYLPLIPRAAACGFDILAVSSGYLVEKSHAELIALKSEAQKYNIELHAGYGPGPDKNILSSDPNKFEFAMEYYKKILGTLNILDIHYLGGNFYSCAPSDVAQPIQKGNDWVRCVDRVQVLADIAKQYNITLAMEVVCRYEGYLINTAAEGVKMVKAINRSNVGLMLDTFHMNIEEDNFASAIHTAGEYLFYLHTGECNRRVPGSGRIPWNEIAYALTDINFNGPITMEPFITTNGSIGKDLGVWRDLSYGATDLEMDNMAKSGLLFTKNIISTARQTKNKSIYSQML